MAKSSGEDRRTVFKKGAAANMDALYNTALRLTRKPEDAEDLVAETLTKAWAALDTLQDTARFRAWVFRILNNTFISNYRKQTVRPKTESYDEAPQEDDENFSLFEKLHQPFLLWWNNPEQEFVAKLLGEDIAAAIDALPDDFRAIAVLVDVEGFSYQEAADITETPIGTVRSRLKRARGQLQRTLWKQARDAGLKYPEQPQARPI